jgi:VWFA-related protein
VAIETYSASSSPLAHGDSEAQENPTASDAAVSASLPLETAIVIDESTTGILDRRDVYDELIRFLSVQTADKRLFLVARFRRGSMQIECPWTGDRETARAAITELRKHPAIELIPSAGVVTGSHTSMLEFQTLRRRLLAALIQTIAAFPDHPARRQLVLVSGGATLAPAFIFAQEFSDAQFGPEQNDARVAERRMQAGANTTTPQQKDQTALDDFELWTRAAGSSALGLSNSDLVAKALERDIALIPIAAAAFDRGTNPGTEKKALRESKPGTTVLSAHLAVTQTMMTLAKETGGEPILVPKRAAKSLKELAEQALFTMTFRDPTGDDHKFHQIALTSRRPGLTLEYRRGYRFATNDERMLDAVFAHLLQPTPEEDPLGTHASATPGVAADGRPLTRLAVKYTPPREREEAAERKCDLFVVGRDAEGTWTAPISLDRQCNPGGCVGSVRSNA